jgi:hypothetical protein
MRRELGRLAETGATVVRWWLLGDGRSGLRESPSGRRVSIDDRLLDDLDAALAALDEAGLQAIFVVIDFLWFAAPALVGGVQTGGRRHLARDPACREALLSSVMAKIAGSHPERRTIAAWDLCNEPEWATLGLGTFDLRYSLSRREMRELLAALARTFRAHARQPLTVGLASARWLPLVDGLDLDFDQVHWYDKVDRASTLREPRRRTPWPRPLLLGEFATRGGSIPPSEVMRIARASGYSGALAWSQLASDHATDGAACLASVATATGAPQQA